MLEKEAGRTLHSLFGPLIQVRSTVFRNVPGDPQCSVRRLTILGTGYSNVTKLVFALSWIATDLQVKPPRLSIDLDIKRLVPFGGALANSGHIERGSDILRAFGEIFDDQSPKLSLLSIAWGPNVPPIRRGRTGRRRTGESNFRGARIRSARGR